MRVDRLVATALAVTRFEYREGISIRSSGIYLLAANAVCTAVPVGGRGG
jgi:hypothetical protein